MFVVHVDLTVEQGLATELSFAYCDYLLPAIMQQQGFIEARLLATRSAEVECFRIVIEFETEELQKRWVTTALHREVWTIMKNSIAKFSVMFFDVVVNDCPLARRQ